MPYAGNGVISREPISGGIPITEEQYKAAIDGMMAGKVVSIRNGNFALVDPKQPEAPPPQPPTFEDQRAEKLAQIDAAFSQAADALTAGYPEAERLTWPIQEREANAWAADNETPTPYLDGIAQARGIDPQTMRELTVAQVQAFSAASQLLVGKRQRLRDAIHAIDAESPNAAAQLAAIVW